MQYFSLPSSLHTFIADIYIILDDGTFCYSVKIRQIWFMVNKYLLSSVRRDELKVTTYLVGVDKMNHLQCELSR